MIPEAFSSLFLSFEVAVDLPHFDMKLPFPSAPRTVEFLAGKYEYHGFSADAPLRWVVCEFGCELISKLRLTLVKDPIQFIWRISHMLASFQSRKLLEATLARLSYFVKH
jgi:hypothetical protein